MKTKVLSIIVALFGQGLLALIFFVLLPQNLLAQNIKVMDFIVCSLVYWLWATFMILPALRLNDPTQKQVGGLGLRMIFVSTYSTIALIFVLVNIVLALRHYPTQLSFDTQLVIHCVLVFILLLGWVFTATATAKTAEVYHHEQALKSGKRALKTELADLLMCAQDTAGVPDGVRRRIEELSAQTRFITPSTSDDATLMDKRITDTCTAIRVALPQYEMNKDNIDAQIEKLGRDIARRKQVF